MRSKPPAPENPNQTACFSHVLELFQHKPGGTHPHYQLVSWAEHVSLHLLCSLEMLDAILRILSPCALIHLLEETGGAFRAS